jgi:MATE family multidrug resistance protein
VLAPSVIVALFLDASNPANAEVIALATVLLGIAAVFQVFDGIQVSTAGALRGLKDTRAPMFIGIVSYWFVGLGTSYVLAFRLDLGAVGLWWGLVVGLAVASTLLLMRLTRRMRGAVVHTLTI